ncbi:hypothetical protein JS84_14850 [Vibrio vulnificus]|uniref:Uncharacterized protein n=1 Tax=Vibrio vulnificus TaxID=672 RepID=A0A2S3R903_VIBVL|nr:hypothetical protein Y702_16845 [Vibrio vulnificus BAA87]KFK61484.1 hypothetical protein JS83_02615 [Vibrio vulnificus]KLI66625.1 hypothetical protein VVYB158_13600 [Vibrio vulnificus CladeA-yb158]KFK63769.1 hypothetical protein JS84_14850 [Vibrio vulnificus]KFK67036.1 hypothetical protein JS85_22225 [Vibrio vulnificus]
MRLWIADLTFNKVRKSKKETNRLINEQTKVKGHWLDRREGNKLNHVARDKKEGKSMTNRWRIKKNAP